MTTETYPLYSLDNGDRLDEQRYRGPFDTIEGAYTSMRDLAGLWTVRRCRRLRASELPFWKGFDFIEFIDDDAADDPPDGDRIWADWDEQLLRERDGAKEALLRWADEYIEVDVYQLEPEPAGPSSRKLDQT